VLTAGLLLVLFHWKPSLEVQAKCKPCALGQADWVIIRVSPQDPGLGSATGFLGGPWACSSLLVTLPNCVVES